MDLVTPTATQNATIAVMIAEHDLRSFIVLNDAGNIAINTKANDGTAYQGTGADIDEALADLDTKF